MKEVTVQQAKRSLEVILREVGQGEVFRWTEDGTEVAELRAVTAAGKSDREGERATLLERLERQRQVGPVSWTREELYDRSV